MSKQQDWQVVLENLKLTLSYANFATWFSQTFIVSYKEVDNSRQITEIGCHSPFAAATIENRYYSLIKEALDKVTGKKNDLVFVVKENETKTIFKEPLFDQPEDQPEISLAFQNVGLRPDFNFESFAVSSSNQMAHAAAQAVAQTPGRSYNPLFLYGGVGVGKTHLMQAIGHAILIKNPGTKIVYCTGEEFTNEIVDAIRRKTTNEFKQRYRTVKLLLVDDIQFIAGKEKVQEEFFHTFNAIWKTGGQIVLTSDRKPEEINKLEDRLRSRFEGGLIIDIQPPDFELRCAILLIKAQQRGLTLPMDIAQLVAGNITSTRKLEGFLIRLASETQTRNLPLSLELAQALLGITDEASIPKKLVKPKEFLKTIVTYFNIKLSDLTGPKRDKPIAMPRQILMYLLRNDLSLPFMEIGHILGNRDHTTIMHGVNKITGLLSTNEDIRVDIAGIRKELYR